MTDNPIEHPQKSEETGKEGDRSSQQSSPILRAELQIPRPAIDEYYSKQKEKQRQENRRFWVQIGTFIIAFLAIGLSGWQAYVARESSRNSNRAYITIVGGPGLRADTAVPQIGVELFHTGYTPALNVRKAIKWETRELPLPSSNTDYLGDPPYEPETFSLTSPEMEPLVTEVNLSAADRQKIESLAYGLVIWGTVEYTTFGQVHHTRFCYVMSPDLKRQQRRCPVHNGTD
ncbi:MAG: hypothetical protein HY313_07115 [Acidobacteria bacterium]|nr:hypothetical protein [Acidobacteriota bacterium]